MKTLITILIISFVLTGCVSDKVGKSYHADQANQANFLCGNGCVSHGDVIITDRKLQSEIDQLKDYLEVEETTGIDKECGEWFDNLIERNMALERDKVRYCTKTYLKPRLNN